MNLFSLFKRPKKEDIFEIFPDGILIVSMDGKILDINQKALKILGFSKLDMLGSYFSQYIQGGSVLLNKLVQTSAHSIAKAAAHNRDDVFVQVSAAKSEEHDKVYVSIKDVSQNYKMQNMINGEYEIAKKIIDEKNSYLTGISGELIALLTSVTNFSKALNDGIVGPLTEKQSKYVGIINKNSTDLLYDIEKLFKYFETESNLYNYEYKNFDIADCLTSIAKNYEILFGKKKLNFSYDLSSFDTRNCSLDPVALEILIKNILDISLKFTDIGTVSLNAGNPPLEFLESKGFKDIDENTLKQYALIEIKDSGFIYPEDVLENISNPYYLTESMSKKVISAKMAYALSAKHVNCLKGNTWIYSKPSKGTLVSILLPMEKA